GARGRAAVRRGAGGDIPAANDVREFDTAHRGGLQGLPKAGSGAGRGGSCHEPVDGGFTPGSTSRSISQGRPEARAVCSASRKSRERLTFRASTPWARASAAKSGL